MSNYSVESQYIGNETAKVALLENRAVVMGADGFVYATAAKEMDGINEYTVVAGEAPRVGIDSIKDAVAGAAIAKGAEVEVSGVEGKLVTLASGLAVGRAYTAATADGSIFALKIK